MPFQKRYAAVFACLTFAGLGLSTAQANTLVVYKLGSTAVGANAFANVVAGLTSSSVFGTNASLTDGSSDYRDNWIDNPLNWDSVTNINVGMYDAAGNQVSSYNFAGPNTAQGTGVTLSSFFAPGNLVSSNYTDLGSFSGNFFSEVGDSNIRNFFINQNYGGCPADVGWNVVVVGGGLGCGWESSRVGSNGRAFLYAQGNVRQNWNSVESIGQANVFAITVTSDLISPVPEPATIALLGSSLAVVGLLRRRRA